MESNEALDHKLPSVEGPSTVSEVESTAAMQMEQPSFSDPVQQVPNNDGTGQQPLVSVTPVDPVGQSIAPTQQSKLSAEDVDLIEKVWVEKAKAIVKGTHGDPYTQNKELSKVKADYIKQRFNKDIKVVE